ARRACRELHVTVLPDARELAVLDDECGIVDGATVADNQPRAVEQRDPVCRTRLAVHLRGAGREQARAERGGEQSQTTRHNAGYLPGSAPGLEPPRNSLRPSAKTKFLPTALFSPSFAR